MKRNALRMVAAIALLLTAQALLATACAAQIVEPEPPKIIRKAGGVLQGSATKRVEPAYPPLAKTARVSGAVVVEVTVDEGGKVIAARAISGHPLLKDAAVNAARGWEFTPTQLSGEPVKVIGTITVNFHLDMKEDIERLKQRIAERPNDPSLYPGLGDSYDADGQTEEALGAFRQALVLKPDYARAWIGIGRAYEGIKRSDEAIEAYQQAIQLDPDDVAGVAFRRIGAIRFEQQRYQEAVEAYKQAIAKYPTAPDFVTYPIHLSLGMAYLKLGDKDSAMEQYRILKEKQPDLAERLLKQINDQQ